jgi:hypothetical protein
MFADYRREEDKLRRQFDAANRCDADGVTGCTPIEEKQRQDLKRRYEENEAEAESNSPIMLGTVIGGVLMMAGGVFLFVTAPKSASATPTTGHTRVVPVLGASRTGLVIEGVF